ncbi:hypothetical protein BGLT_02256 [Caballeronia glathei]|uniref:Uncharacterized protein n=1 Tax=Caballeronia glathei TaxID=60547 RepID=A0A069PW60_9BURK|nr:hypothetical protein [Caballeronia glathei]KDR41591.1 hypothetical protein BG61_16755 [Caballeronia glathei]CDY79475.1 hypothetical protein BGLT_02256 [Caballeronia glathei]
MAAARDYATPHADGGGSYSAPKVYASNAPSRITLNLGVIDIPYSNAPPAEKVPQAKKGKANKPLKPKSSGGTKTTGDVAEILEDKYGIMDTFAYVQLPDIAKALEESIAGSLETLLMGGMPSANPFASAESKITAMFKQFLATGAIEHMGIEGVPTQAALNGVNHRLKHPYAKGNPRRESFIDTGLYQSHFLAWFS